MPSHYKPIVLLNDLQGKMKDNFTFRLDDDLRARIEALQREKAKREGRFVPLSEIVTEALDYGIELVQQDIFREIALPRGVKTRKQRLLLAAKQVFEKGLEALDVPSAAV